MISLKAAKKNAAKIYPGQMLYVGWWKNSANAPHRLPTRLRAKVRYMVVG